MRRGAIVQLTLLALLIGGVVTVVAVYPHWLPPTASEQADRIDFVFWYVTAICIDVTGQQFAWTFKYPQSKGLTTNILRLPIHRPTRFTLRALDVIHSFWVPEFGQKQDAVPGTTTQLTVTPNKLGVYPIICTELCGLGHAVMRSAVV